MPNSSSRLEEYGFRIIDQYRDKISRDTRHDQVSELSGEVKKLEGLSDERPFDSIKGFFNKIMLGFLPFILEKWLMISWTIIALSTTFVFFRKLAWVGPIMSLRKDLILL